MTQHSLEEKTLTELKQLALELEITPDQIAEYGDRRCRSTWIKAIRSQSVGWPVAAQRAGKTTQEYRELPITKKIAAQVKGEQPEQPEPELWCDNMFFLGQLEDFFFQQKRAEWVVPEPVLEWMPVEDERFKCWSDWIIPGNLFTTFRQGRTYQILMIDKTSKVYYLPVDRPQLMATYLMAIRQFAYPTPLPESGGIVEAADYIRFLHEATEEPDYRYMEIRV